MAFANPSVTDIIATTIENRRRQIADNVSNNNAFLKAMEKSGNIDEFDGGSVIFEELSQAANGNAGWYSGYDQLPVAAQDVITAAQFSIAQCACPVTVSGLERIQNSGRERTINLVDARMEVAEESLRNLMDTGLFSDGTGFGGKQILGLNAAVPAGTSTGRIATGTYGGIDRSTTVGSFWRPYYLKQASPSATTVQGDMNTLFANLTRGTDMPNLVMGDNNYWSFYLASLQTIQRFTSPEVGQLGFMSLKYQTADFVLAGGYNGNIAASTLFMLNTKYFKYRPYSERNMVPLEPNRRYAVNQDADVAIIGWAGNTTCRNQFLQGRIGTT